VDILWITEEGGNCEDGREKRREGYICFRNEIMRYALSGGDGQMKILKQQVTVPRDVQKQT
jgi:hypothetical protein